MSTNTSVTCVAPPSVSNLGPGFDILGCAVEGDGDTVTATLDAAPGVFVDEAGHAELTTDPTRHASAVAAAALLRAAGRTDVGVRLRVRKGIPLSSGQGGSAASSVAAALSVNALLGAPLDSNGVLLAALVAEERVAGRHGDNLAAALHGGIVIVRSLEPPDVIRLAVPDELRVVVAHPDQRMNTREGRAVVPASFPRETLVWQAAQVAALVAGLSTSDYALISRALGDRVAEPYRAPLLPGFAEARAAALASGALGASISGSGPTSFALVRGDAAGQRVAAAMAAAYEALGVRCEARVSRVAGGARLNSGR